MCKHLNIEVLFSGETCGKEPARQRRRLNRWFPSLGGEDPRRREWQPTPVFLPGESQGHRSLAGCSPWGHKRVGHDGSDVASTGGSTVKNPPANAGNTRLTPGCGRSPRKGNVSPLQYSCLGNSMDRGTW